MELSLWLSLVMICILGAMSPGPSLALLFKNTLLGGTKQGYATAISHGLGVALYAVITAAGIGMIIVKSPVLFSIIQYSGAAFLLYLGLKSLLSKKPTTKSLTNVTDQQDSELLTSSGQQQKPAINGWRDGFLIVFLNPKLAIFFFALFSQFLSEQASLQQKIIMTATVGTIDTLWYVLVAFAISRGPIINKLRNNSYLIEKITGSVLILLAARVVVN